jgi:hypothetical protein
MPDEGSAQDLQYAMDQLANMPPPSPSSDEPSSPTAPPPDPDYEYDGSSRRESHTAHSAARELSFARRKRGQEADGADPAINFVDPLHYQREPEGELTAEQAGKDLSQYRQQAAQKLLQELTGEQAAPEVAPTPQPDQPPQYTAEQLEQAAQRQQAEAHAQHAQQVAGDYDNLLQASIAALMGQGQEFADVKALANQIGEQAALAQLAEKDPARFARFSQLDSQVRQVRGELGRIRQQQAEVYAQAYQQYADAHDRAADQAIPELTSNDPQVRHAMRQGALDVLTDAGFSKDEIRFAYERGGTFMLRDVRVAKVIADAVRYRQGQQRMKEAVAQPHPAVQRPGVRMPESSFSQQLIEGHSKALSGSGNIRDAIAMRRAQYAQRRNG